eukprot:scaffold6647_cov166-Amphora_coffeaeformis.AAC.1
MDFNSDVEVQSGRILEGGKVMDFSAVKASAKAEDALKSARKQILASKWSGTNFNANEILGINKDVIQEVGHPLGEYATAKEIQDCATWIRSKAPDGLFKPKTGVSFDSSSFSTQDVTDFQRILRKSFEEAGEVTSAFAKTFYMGTMLLGEEARMAIWAIYVWCRRTDEIVDAPRDSNDEMLRDLSLWELRLEDLWSHGEVVDVYDLTLLQVLAKYPTLDITPFMDMIRGMLMDVPGLGRDRYDRFDELHLYCYRVAGTVGLMSLPIFGCAAGFDDETAREPALSLGVAFQLTNILRDVGEDAVQRGRIYLPREDLERFGVTEDQIFSQELNDNYRRLMKFEIDRARMYYARARRGVYMLAPSSRLPVQSSLDAYGRILDKIEENDFDSLTKRAYVGKWEKLSKPRREKLTDGLREKENSRPLAEGCQGVQASKSGQKRQQCRGRKERERRNAIIK